jgi:hypothetical protein
MPTPTHADLTEMVYELAAKVVAARKRNSGSTRDLINLDILEAAYRRTKDAWLATAE